jgi:hypothetical protein
LLLLLLERLLKQSVVEAVLVEAEAVLVEAEAVVVEAVSCCRSSQLL